ncbi:MAG: DUF1993 domain-containing protein [Henriciella sp.]|uniref:DUF1993 domain-containing protein n=1 Tax=Henriciella sp. TaxID=1968823 RepID=UPI003C76E86D
MSLSLYDAIIPAYSQILGSTKSVLEKGAQHCKSKGKSPDELLDECIHSDMLPLTFQLHSVMHHTLGALEGVRTGEFGPPGQLEKLDYAGFQEKIENTINTVGAMKAEQVDSWAGKPVVFKLGETQIPFTAEGFLFSFSKPNVYFHATTAYNILRMKGVPLGKRDFLGQLQVKTG